MDLPTSQLPPYPLKCDSLSNISLSACFVSHQIFNYKSKSFNTLVHEVLSIPDYGTIRPNGQDLAWAFLSQGL